MLRGAWYLLAMLWALLSVGILRARGICDSDACTCPELSGLCSRRAYGNRCTAILPRHSPKQSATSSGEIIVPNEKY